ncbi:MAG: HopJ type III effector protein [Cellvibrionaceae bacterium]
MKLEELLKKINESPLTVAFNEVMDTISEYYHYTPTQFTNGEDGDIVINEAGSNEGSCKLFAFAKDQSLSKEQTLSCFGTYYREDVLEHPNGSDHTNIRTFIKYGWDGISFDQSPLLKK